MYIAEHKIGIYGIKRDKNGGKIMKVWKNKNMPEWNPETGTHYQQRITLGEIEQKQYGLNYPIGTHYPNLSILDYFKGETFKKYKMDYCNTCIKIVKE